MARPTLKQRIAASPHIVRPVHDEVFSGMVRELGVRWRDCADRPIAKAEVLDHWSELLEGWAQAPEYPLLVRKARGNRGHRVLHSATNRVIIPCDNAAANWVCYQVLSGRKPQADELLEDLEAGRWPLAQVLDAGFHYTGSLTVCPENLNSLGWKVCHLVEVALGGRGSLENEQEERLRDHFLRFLNPSNMIVVPKKYGGVAESSDFLAAFLDAGERRGV